MASLTQYSTALHQASAPDRAAPGAGTRWFGCAIYASIVVLVVIAAMQAG